MKSIFIQISSYHDYELSGTIFDALKKSSSRFHINFGVHHIFHEVDDVDIPVLRNLKVSRSKAPENLGMGLGRHIAHQFYDGEDYYLQVDAHTRFEQEWDLLLTQDIERYQAEGFDKPLLTTYPKNYWYGSGGEFQCDAGLGVSYISFHERPEQFLHTRNPSQTAMHTDVEKNIFTKSVSGGSVFTVGEFLTPNKKIWANGEEIFIAARAYTSGYDLLIPRKNVLSHLYYNHNNPTANRRRLSWADYPDVSASMNARSMREIYDVLTQGLVGPDRLGTERTIEEFGMFAGLDFANGIVLENCYWTPESL